MSSELVGGITRLRPPVPADYEWLYVAATTPPVASAWRLAGSNPGPERFVELLWSDCQLQYMVETRRSRRRLGLVQLTGYNSLGRHAKLSVMTASPYLGSGQMIEGVILFVRYAFDTFDLKKMYLESTEHGAAQYSSAVGHVLRREGILRDHIFQDGEWQDLHIFALHRPDVERIAALIDGREYQVEDQSVSSE